jgi:hypothetical protein
MDTRDTTPVLPAPKTSRSCRLLDMGEGRLALVMTFIGPRSRKQTRYHISPVPGAEDGWEVRKFSCDLEPGEGGEPYHVDLAEGSCDCLGALRWGHRKPCRHLASLRALRERGSI